MTAEVVSGDESEVDDDLTTRLVRAKLILDIVGSILAAAMLADMMNHGQLQRIARWHWDKWKARFEAERQTRLNARYVIWTAEKILEGSQ